MNNLSKTLISDLDLQNVLTMKSLAIHQGVPQNNCFMYIYIYIHVYEQYKHVFNPVHARLFMLKFKYTSTLEPWLDVDQGSAALG